MKTKKKIYNFLIAKFIQFKIPGGGETQKKKKKRDRLNFGSPLTFNLFPANLESNIVFLLPTSLTQSAKLRNDT